MKLSTAHEFNWIVLRVKFGLTSYEELPPALCSNTLFKYAQYSIM